MDTQGRDSFRKKEGSAVSSSGHCEQIHYNEDRRVVVEPGSAEDLIDGRSHRAEAVRAQVAEGSGGEEGR